MPTWDQNNHIHWPFYTSIPNAQQDMKARLISWILLLQKFDLEIWDKKGIKNVIADRLSHVPNAPSNELPINGNFPDEQLLANVREPWFADIVNYLVTNQTPSHWSKQDVYRFLSQVRYFIWEESYLFKYCFDQIIRRCIPDEEVKSDLAFCHELTCGGHFGPRKIAKKVLQSGFYWPTLFKDAFDFCKTCTRCQIIGKISKHNMMPLNPILKVELFDIWGIDFMGPFPISFRHQYILLAVDYVSK